MPSICALCSKEPKQPEGLPWLTLWMCGRRQHQRASAKMLYLRSRACTSCMQEITWLHPPACPGEGSQMAADVKALSLRPWRAAANQYPESCVKLLCVFRKLLVLLCIDGSPLHSPHALTGLGDLCSDPETCSAKKLMS